MKYFPLVKPDAAEKDTKEIYDDIIKTLGKDKLTPIWGFFGNDSVVLKAFWSLSKHLKIKPTVTPKKYLYGIALVAAVKIGCARCTNTHERELIDLAQLSSDFVEKVKNYEECYQQGQLDREFYLALKFGEIIAFEGSISDELWQELNEVFTHKQLFEMINIAFLEYCLARYGITMGVFDESVFWPQEYTPSENYQSVITGRHRD